MLIPSIETTIHVPAIQRREDRFHDTLGLFQHVSVPKSQDAIAVQANERITPFIIVRLFNVLAAVQLDDDRRFEADEIADIGAEWALPAKLEARKSAITQGVPEMPFGIGRVLAQ